MLVRCSQTSLLMPAVAVWLIVSPVSAVPPQSGDLRTPETRMLTAEEATQALQRDWLFQAMGEPLRSRTAQEIGWARTLAERIGRQQPTPDLSAELRVLDALQKRLGELPETSVPAPTSQTAEAVPSWIWYPEGIATEDAPAATRFFRCRFELPAGVRTAELRVAADDACEAFVNGTRVGAHETWQRTAVFAVGPLLKAGGNVLAVRAENRPAPSKNPAGLIARLTVTLADGQQRILVSDGSWRAEKELRPQWEQAAFDDAAWKTATVAAAFGGGPWGKIAGLEADVQDDPLAAYAGESPAVKELYCSVRQIKRNIQFKHPVLDFTQLLFIDQPLPQGPESRHEAIHRMGIMAVPGGRLLVLDGLHPGGQLRQLAPDRPGSFWRPDLSFDARRVLFCFKPHDEKSFHLYELNFDGTGLRQLTDSEYDDIDPIYLPDGHLLFTTTRGNSYVRCGPFIYSYILARCDADGDNVYLTSYNGEPDFVPALLNDGRVVYSRWEYSDKPLWRLQKLWTTNQDGTGTAHFWGNQSIWPDHLSEPRPIPGSRRVMFSGVGHHDWWSGSIGIVDPDQGRDYPHGLTKVTADLRWPEVSLPPEDRPEAADYHAAGRFTGYKTAYPLSAEDLLVSARGVGDKFRLYLMDVHGNRELIYEGVHNIWHAMPVKPRPVPPRQLDRVAWPGTGKDRRPVEPGVFFSADVYQGVPELPRGLVRYLRVFQLDYKTYSTWNKTYRNSGPPVSIVQEEGVKRILSEVPVESDGSVYFEAPAGRTLFFQLLDADRRCVHTMRSFTGLMPREQRGCVGCHEGHSTAPPRQGGLALQRPPTKPSPPPWGIESIGYERFAQPVLDRYCVQCHQGKEPGPAEPNLALRPGHSVFKEPYLTLVGPAGWSNPVGGGRPGYGIAGAIPVESQYGQNDPAALTTLRPMQYLAYKSRLIELASSGKHYDVRVDPLSLHRLIAWVDACCPFMGDEELRALGDPDFPGIAGLPIRPRVATAPVIERP
ncbi:MAG: hypothetical protein NTY19_17675 [Planctomycetota bacterium]|nr:hypothetical protein [Planctomycetota bacterium]